MSSVYSRSIGQLRLSIQSALVAIQEKTGCSFSPRLVPGDACRPCTESVFLGMFPGLQTRTRFLIVSEKLYLQQHPVFVERWDCLSDRDVSSWISKRWLRGALHLLDHSLSTLNSCRLEVSHAKNALFRRARSIPWCASVRPSRSL